MRRGKPYLASEPFFESFVKASMMLSIAENSSSTL
jgi:hypothetical protein